MNKKDFDYIKSGVLSGDTRSLARAITLIESGRNEDIEYAQKLLSEVMQGTQRPAFRIGVSGSPGAGKSTFIEALGCYLVDELQLKVAVLAVDPSSPVSGGSLLGDKTRMESLSQKQGAFIRPSPSKGTLGGVSYTTREAILLCEAAGYDIVLVETVGVGQSEYEVRDMVDLFLLLALPNSGDELQGIKKGILELVDLILVNKCDGDNKSSGQRAQAQLKSALELIKSASFSTPEVLMVSALKLEGISEAYSSIEKYFKKYQSKIEALRKTQNSKWLDRLILALFKQKLMQDEEAMDVWELERKNVEDSQETPFLAAEKVVQTFLKNQR